MSDTVHLRARIADELNRQESDIIGSPSLSVGYVINREINEAIRHYESTRFRWNELREVTIASTTSGGRYVSLPADFVKMDSLKLIYSGGDSYIRLKKRTWDELEEADREVSASDGPPTRYAFYANHLRLFPVPDQAYTLVGSYIRRFRPTSLSGSYCAVVTMGGGSLTATSTASHNNHLDGWTTDGEALIRARARASIEINYLNNAGAKIEAGQLALNGLTYLSLNERSAFERLADETQDAQSTGRIRPVRI